MSNLELAKCFKSFLLHDQFFISFVYLAFKFVMTKNNGIEHGRFARSSITDGHHDIRIFDHLQTLNGFLDALNKEHERLLLLE